MTDLATESRVALLERDQVPDELRPLYDKLLEERGVVPNMFKAVSNVPALALGFAALLKPLMGDGHLQAWYKELIATYVATLNQCEYCVSSHRYLAKLRGASPEQIDAVESYESGPFTEKEKAGFAYAGVLHVTGNAVDETAYGLVRRFFEQEEFIELTAVAAAFEFFPRFNSALGIPVTPLPNG